MPPARARSRDRRQPRRRLPGHDNPRPSQDLEEQEEEEGRDTSQTQDFQDSYASYGAHHDDNIEEVGTIVVEGHSSGQTYDAWDDEPSQSSKDDHVRQPHTLDDDDDDDEVEEEAGGKRDYWEEHDVEKELLWAEKWEQRVKDYHQPTEADKQRERDRQANFQKILYILEGATCCFALMVVILIIVLATTNNGYASNTMESSSQTDVAPPMATLRPGTLTGLTARRTAAPTSESSIIKVVIPVPGSSNPAAVYNGTATPAPVIATSVQVIPGVTTFQCRENTVLGPLSVDGSLHSDSNIGLPLTLADDICGGGADVAAFQWFSFHGTGHSVAVSTCSVDTSFLTIIGIFGGSCAEPLQCVTYASNGGCPNGWKGSTVLVSTAKQGTYYASVGGEQKSTGTFGLSLYQMSTGCMQAESVAVNGPVVVGSNVGAVTSGGACDTEAVGATKWYTFEATAEQIAVSTCLAGTEFQTLVAVYSGSCHDNSLQCLSYTSQGGCATGMGSIVLLDAIVGETYYVAVMGVNHAEGNFGLQLLMG